MAIYTELDNLKDEKELTEFAVRLKDRFGDIPKQVVELFNGMKIKWLATSLGMERIWLKKGKMNCYFIQNQQAAFYESATFGNIIKFIGQKPQGVQMKEKGKYLILTFVDVKNMKEAQNKLGVLGEFVYGK